MEKIKVMQAFDRVDYYLNHHVESLPEDLLKDLVLIKEALINYTEEGDE